MKPLNFAILSTIMLSVMSCGSKKESLKAEDISLTPKTTEVMGDFEGYFTVVDRKYKGTEANWSDLKIIVEFNRTGAKLPFDVEKDEILTYNRSSSENDYVNVGFGIEFLDEDGDIVYKKSADDSWNSSSEFLSFVKLKEGKTGTLTFTAPLSDIATATSFRILSAFDICEPSPSVSGSSSSSSSSSSSLSDVTDLFDSLSSGSTSAGSAEIDEMIDAYEKYYTDYIKLLKKAQNGDLSAIPEYIKVLKDANDYYNKLSNCKGDMSVEQINRLNKINMNLVEAATE